MVSSETFQPVVEHTVTSNVQATSTDHDVMTNVPVSMVQLDSEKGIIINASTDHEDSKGFPDEVPDYGAQRGIQKIEATTLAWSKCSLAAVLIKYVTINHL